MLAKIEKVRSRKRPRANSNSSGKAKGSSAGLGIEMGSDIVITPSKKGPFINDIHSAFAPFWDVDWILFL